MAGEASGFRHGPAGSLADVLARAQRHCLSEANHSRSVFILVSGSKEVAGKGGCGFEDKFTVARTDGGCLILRTPSLRGKTERRDVCWRWMVFLAVRSVLLKRCLLVPIATCVPSLKGRLLLGSECDSFFFSLHED